MPLYEYECDKGHRFELIRKFSDGPLEACPTCGAPVHKLISSPAFQFKGTGWYVTDYPKKDVGGASSSDSKSDAAAKDSSKSESSDKTAEKGEKAAKSDKADKPAKSESTADTKAGATAPSGASTTKPGT
jgi:putative FmdB family regulatory protein